MADFVDVENEYQKDKQLKKEDVRQLQEWASKHPHLPKISERQMIFFLHSCYYSNETAKACIETYYTVRAHCPEFFSNRNLRLQTTYDEILGGLVYMPLPKLTPEGYKIIYGRLVFPEPGRYEFANMIKSLDMTNALMLHQQGAYKGIIFMGDFWSFTMGHISKLNLLQIKKFFVYFQEAMPLRIVGIHIVNVNSLIDTFVGFFKPFMKKDLANNFKVYLKVPEDFLKVIPMECLPKDYGGPLDSIEELRRQWCENMLAHADFFLEDEKAKADESKRLGKRRNTEDIFGIEGSFKKLDID